VTALGSRYRGVVARRLLPNFARDECAARASQRLNRRDETLPVAQRNPELFEIAFGELWQHTGVDIVLDECCLILSESQVSQPAANVHGSALIPLQTCALAVTNPRRATQEAQRGVPQAV
jgi:hypothetical protein